MPDRRQFLGLLGASGGVLAARAAAGEAVQTAPHPAATGGKLRIALMQASPVGNDQQRNLEKAEAYCRQAAQQGSDVLLMPEMWNIGYQGFSDFSAETTRRWQEQAIATDGPWVGHFRRLAREINLAIAVTYLQRWPGAPRNTVSVIDRHGNLALTYAKVHTCAFAFEAALTPGDSWPTTELDTALGGVRVGAMICFDREFPESARSLMLAGAELVLTPNACLLDPLRTAQFRVRAFENAFAVAMTNYAAPLLNGGSVAFDAAGSPLVEADHRERLWFADIDLGALRDYRGTTLWGDAWRRPSSYAGLSRSDTIAPFQRTDAYGQTHRQIGG